MDNDGIQPKESSDNIGVSTPIRKQAKKETSGAKSVKDERATTPAQTQKAQKDSSNDQSEIESLFKQQNKSAIRSAQGFRYQVISMIKMALLFLKNKEKRKFNQEGDCDVAVYDMNGAAICFYEFKDKPHGHLSLGCIDVRKTFKTAIPQILKGTTPKYIFKSTYKKEVPEEIKSWNEGKKVEEMKKKVMNTFDKLFKDAFAKMLKNANADDKQRDCGDQKKQVSKKKGKKRPSIILNLQTIQKTMKEIENMKVDRFKTKILDKFEFELQAPPLDKLIENCKKLISEIDLPKRKGKEGEDDGGILGALLINVYEKEHKSEECKDKEHEIKVRLRTFTTDDIENWWRNYVGNDKPNSVNLLRKFEDFEKCEEFVSVCEKEMNKVLKKKDSIDDPMSRAEMFASVTGKLHQLAKDCPINLKSREERKARKARKEQNNDTKKRKSETDDSNQLPSKGRPNKRPKNSAG